MQKDMHYYGTYAMARAAGLKREVCQTIATAAEFVDDNGEKDTIVFSDGGRLDFVPTAHHVTSVIKNLDLQDQRHVWLPFHFMPGNEGTTMSERLICRKNSPLAQAMLKHNLALAGEPYGIHLMGISAHIYADTFSHYGFSGVSSRWNRIDSSSIKLHKIEKNSKIGKYLKEKEEKFKKRYGEEMSKLPNFRDLHSQGRRVSKIDQWKSNVAESATGALGHGAALTYPDRPYLRWEFTYELPKKLRRSSGLRDNQKTFLEACEKLHALFCELYKQHPKLRGGKPQQFKKIRGTVKKILAMEEPCKRRIRAWEEAAMSGVLFGQSERIRPYQGPQWKKGLEALRNKPDDSRAALKKPIFRFFQAAANHRTFVLRDLFPKHDLVVD